MPLSLRKRYSQSYRRFKKPGYSRAHNMVFNYIRKKNNSYSPSNEQFIYSQAIKNNVRLCTQYYADLVYKELRRYIMPSLQMRSMILRFFKSLKSGDYTYQQLNVVEFPSNYGVTLKLREVNYESVAAAIASCITRELNNQNYGYALFPKYPYYYSDKNGVFLFPSAPIINCLYTQNQQQNIRMIFNKYFSQPPNFGAAYDCAVNQYPLNTNGVQYSSQGILCVPQGSPAYPLQVASQYTYQLPYKFVDKMLYFVNSADDINMYVNRGPNNYLVNKYESNGKLPAGYYTPKQMMYLIRPFMYSYYQPDVPIYQSFTNYFTLHKGKWPDQDIRQVLTHFMAMDQFVDFDQNDQPIFQGVSSGKPLLGVRTQKEDDEYYHRQEYVSGDPIDGLYRPSDYIPVDGHFITDYQNAVQSGLDQYSVPQIDLNHKNDLRRVPDEQFVHSEVQQQVHQLPQRQPVSKSKCFCFTCNNYNPETLPALEESLKKKNCQYYVIGKEVGESGTPHLQGFVQFKNRILFTTCSHVLLDSCHVEVMKGTSLEASAYCKKDGDFVEYGQLLDCRSGSGARNDLKKLVTTYNSYNEAVLNPDNLGALMNGRNVVMDYYAAKIQQSTLDNFLCPKVVIWICGPSGCGKTYTAKQFCFNKYKGSTFEPHCDLSRWCTGYTDQKCVLIDEFRRNRIPWLELLRATDQYYTTFEQKGSAIAYPWKPEIIIFTCVGTPRECFSFKDNQGQLQDWDGIEQLERRINLLIQYDSSSKNWFYTSHSNDSNNQIIDEVLKSILLPGEPRLQPRPVDAQQPLPEFE